MNDRGGAGEAAGGISSSAAMDDAGKTVVNGKELDNAVSLGARSSGGGLYGMAQKSPEGTYAGEATGAPIGLISCGHDGGSSRDSRSFSLGDTYDAYTKGGGLPAVDTATFAGDSCASIAAHNVTSSDNKIGDGYHLHGNEGEHNDVVEERQVSDTEQKTAFSPASLRRSYSMPEKTLKGDHDPERVEGGGTATPSTRLPSASLTSKHARVGAPSGEKANEQQLKQPQQSQQQQIQQPISLSSEDDEISMTLPQTLEQSTIVEKSPAERYIRFNEKLGSGAYKDVYRAYDTIEGIEVAWNVVKLHGVPKAERVRIVNEVRLLERLHHPNIISFHGSWVNRETERVIFVTEILSSGTLKSFVQKVQLIRWKIFKRWAIQILKGLEYLHSQDPPIIHRDLKCDNIFINGTSGDLRIGDFGLSTAISKKNQPLSVLGTPEFMSPELYDENYDEKVDIYAFGMLLLEIITNQVPYHECANPAQIYKKVISGIPPASLRRVKSENARNFILLCLGIGKDASLRPSAAELLNNPFLAKHVNDDGTIEVEPAIEEMVIDEMAPLESRPSSLRDGKGASLTISETASERSAEKFSDQYNAKYSHSIDGYELPSKGVGFPPNAEQDGVRDESTVSSKPSDNANGEPADDHFGEMPENEANMKRVKVLMGRGTALDDDEEPPSQQLEETSLSNPPPAPQIYHVPAPLQAAKSMMTRTISELDASSLGSAPQYKVSAVPHPEIPSSNDAINLALTLPDENQTTVEFVFDLVNDDPVQVAKEMVMELDEVPNDAVLDISEAISGLARHVRQQNFLAQKQQQHGMLMHQQGGIIQSQGIPQPQQPGLGGQQQVMYGSGYSGIGYQTPGAPMVQSHIGAGNDMSSTLQQQHQQTPHLIFQTPGGANMGEGNDGNPSLQQQPVPPAHVAFQSSSGPPIVQQHLGDQQHHHNVSFHTPGGTSNIQQNVMTKQQQQHVLGYQAPAGALGQQQQHSEAHSHISVPHHLRMGSDLSTQQTRQLSPVPQPTHMAVQRTQQLRPSSIPQLTQPNLSQQNVISLRSIDTSISTDEALPTQAPPVIQPTTHIKETQSLHEAVTVQSHDSGVQSAPTSLPQHKEAVIHGSQPPHMVVVPESSELEDGADDDGVDAEEMRKLEEEFEKRLQRAKKSFGTRMDNLHRSKVEAEAQHLMTLEKHEKERIEFEKRVRLAEEEQNRRLNQIEKEFMEKRNQFRQQRAGQFYSEKPPLHGGHKRSSSHFDPSLQRPTPAADLRRNISMQQPKTNDHRRNHSTQSSISCSASDISEDAQVDSSHNSPSSGGLFIEDIKNQPAPNHQPVRQVESSPSLANRDRSDSTSSPA
eukprot:CCRYP_012640-RA/>CCRYP_012640-RA protein AED:0.05 eAED:0.05 QI:315/1/1/1/0.66/0.5/4/577/1338